MNHLPQPSDHSRFRFFCSPSPRFQSDYHPFPQKHLSSRTTTRRHTEEYPDDTRLKPLAQNWKQKRHSLRRAITKKRPSGERIFAPESS